MSRYQFDEIIEKLSDPLTQHGREQAIMSHVQTLAYEAHYVAEQTGVDVRDVIDAMSDQLHAAEAMMF